MHPAIRGRALERFLKESGVREPEDAHIALAEDLVFSDKPSARASFPGGVTITRQYDVLTVLETGEHWEETVLPCPGQVSFGDYLVTCAPAEEIINTPNTFTVVSRGELHLRPRRAGDAIRLPGGTKSLKKLFIDRKIPAALRERIPVLCDEEGILGVYSIGVNLDRSAGEGPAVTVRFEKTEKKGE